MFSQVRKKQKSVSMLLVIIITSSWASLACQTCFSATDHADENVSVAVMPCHQDKVSKDDQETNADRDNCEKCCERIYSDATLEVVSNNFTTSDKRIYLDEIEKIIALNYLQGVAQLDNYKFIYYYPPPLYARPNERYDVLLI